MDATKKSSSNANALQKTNNRKGVKYPRGYGCYGTSNSTNVKKSSTAQSTANTTSEEVKKARKAERRSRKIAKIKKQVSKLIQQLKSSFSTTSDGKYCKSGAKPPFYNKVNWYWDIRKWIPVIMIAFIITVKVCSPNGESTPELEAVDNTPAPVQVYEEETTEETTEPTIPQDEIEIIELARLADTCARRYGDDVKRTVMWVVINRVEDHSKGYGKSLLEEISRPKQWQEYNPDGSYTQSTLDIAREVYTTWKTDGPRPMYNDMIFFAFNADGSVTVRNDFKTSNRTNTMTFGP